MRRDEDAQGTISWEWERVVIRYFPFGALKLVESLSSRGFRGSAPKGKYRVTIRRPIRLRPIREGMSRRFPILAVLLLSFCGSVQVDAGFPGAVEDHVQRAKAIAGSDLKSLPELVCRPAAEQVPYAIKNIPGFLDPKAPGIEPFAAFDNLY